MNYTIENEFLKIEIDSLGAELQAIRAKDDNHNFLWNGNPAIWAGRAPILFPIVGAMPQDKYLYKGKAYTMLKHGFARRSEFSLSAKTDTSLELTLRDSAETLLNFPFSFRLDIRFSLNGKKLTVSHTVTNEGDDVMWFSLGAHPAFVCDLGDTLRFETKETIGAHRLIDDLLTEHQEPFLDDSDIWTIKSDSFDLDAQILEGLNSKAVTLERQSGRNLRFGFNTPFLGIWAKPGAPYVCLEPWFGVDDTPTHDGDFTKKKGIENLPPQETLTLTYDVEIVS